MKKPKILMTLLMAIVMMATCPTKMWAEDLDVYEGDTITLSSEVTYDYLNVLNGTLIVDANVTVTKGFFVNNGVVIINAGNTLYLPGINAFNGGKTFNYGTITADNAMMVGYNYFSNIGTVNGEIGGESWYNYGIVNGYYQENTVAICDHSGSHTSLGTHVDATCTEPSGMQERCDNCGKIVLIADSVTDALGHDVPTTFDNGIKTCSRCGEHEFEAPTTDKEDNYLIGNAGQLITFANWVNKDQTNYKSAHAKLTAEIVVNDGVFSNDGSFVATGETSASDPIEWPVIGRFVEFENGCFSGIFDGQGHSISGLYAKYTNVGLIGLCKDGKIKNVGVVNSYFEGGWASGICAGMSGTSEISDCYAQNILKGAYIGGIVGSSFFLQQPCGIKNCYSTSSLINISYDSNTGGILGTPIDDETKITNCYTNHSIINPISAEYNIGCEAGVSSERFASGEIAYKLGWYQRLGEAGDSYPVLRMAADSSNIVYCGYKCDTLLSYANTELSSTPGHNYVNHLCTKCHEYESAVMVTAENRDTLGFTNSSFDGWYAIANAYQFAWFANKVNNDYDNYKNANAVLIADIDLTVIGKWAPIGTFQHTTYEGNFDGQNHSITGMTIEFSSSNQGLFGNVANNTVQNFTLSGSMSTLVGANWVGSVAGYCHGTTFKNIVSNVDISYAAGKGGAHVGGLVGHAYSFGPTTQISHCTYNGTFDAGTSSDCVGGIAGYTINKTRIEYCVNNGTVKTTATSGHIGGILGYVNSAGFPGIQNCLNTGSISAGNGAAVGAIGGNFKSAGANSNNNYYLVGSAANAIGANSSGKAMNATPLTKEQLKSGMACYRMNGNSSSNVHWYQNLDTDTIPVLDASHGTVYYGYDACRLSYSNSELSATTAAHDYVNGICSLCGKHEPAVLVTEENRSQFNITDTIFDGYYAISNANDLVWLAEAVATDNGQFKGANAVLTADIDLESISNWSPIGTADSVYAGTFEGQGHSISGMKINFSSNYQGLFGRTMGATLQNFSVSGTMSTSTGGFGIGGIVGSAEGSSLLNIVSNVNITVAEGKSCSHIAGVAGRAAGNGNTGTSVSLCTYNGTLDAGNSVDCVGGIVGYTNDYCSITNCLNTGNVASSNDGAYIGGILGYVNNATFKGIKNCLNTGSVSGGNGTDGAICGRYRNAATGEISTGNYFLAGSATKGVGIIENNNPISATAVTSEQLKSGEVCYWLNDSTSTGALNWFQKLGENGDSIPTLTLAADSSNIVYYGYDVCYLTYANDSLSASASAHDYSGLSAADEYGLKSYLCAHCHAADTSRSDIRVIENFSNNTNLELKVDSSNCYTAGDVIIADGTLAKFGVDFKAKSVTYKRPMLANNGKYALIVPLNIDAEKMAELGTLYQFDRVESAEEKLYFTTATEVEANKAYYFVPSQNVDSIAMKDSTVVYATASVYAIAPSASGLYGSYAQMDAPEGAYVYAVQGNVGTFVKADAESKINPFGAYLWLNESLSESLTTSGFGEEETAIESLKTVNGTSTLFNLNGQRIASPRQGGIYIQNNKMIINK